MNLGTKLQQAQVDAQRELAMLQNSLVQQLRERVRPVARDVAKSRGLNTVLVKNLDVLFYHEDGQEITDEVVEKLLASGARAPQPITPTPGSTYPEGKSAPVTGSTYDFPHTAEKPGENYQQR